MIQKEELLFSKIDFLGRVSWSNHPTDFMLFAKYNPPEKEERQDRCYRKDSPFW